MQLSKTKKRGPVVQRGAVVVESVVGMLVFCVIIFGLIEVMRYGYTWLSLHYAASVGARFASMRTVADVPVGTRAAAVKNAVRSAVAVRIQDSDIQFYCWENNGQCLPPLGSPNLPVEVRISKPFNGLVGIFPNSISVAAVAINEPWDDQ